MIALRATRLINPDLTYNRREIMLAARARLLRERELYPQRPPRWAEILRETWSLARAARLTLRERRETQKRLAA